MVVLNGKDPSSEATRSLAAALGEKYGVTVLPLDVKNMKKADSGLLAGMNLDVRG